MKFKVDISEILKATIDIEADNENEAIGMAKQMYNNSDIVLSADNFEDVKFTIMEENDDN
ncbi:MAG: DpnD/PcfM family protein [Clostridia bacterium]|nr:DpnD/PcfM family protein [Clostridia bacterium]